MRPLRYLWAFPTTLIGLQWVALACVTGGKAQVVSGVLECHGGAARWLLRRMVISGPAAAITLGHVVLGQTAADLDCSRRHERVHVRQCERWGPFFIPAYGAASLWQWLRRRDAYRDNPFEIEAYAVDASDDRST